MVGSDLRANGSLISSLLGTFKQRVRGVTTFAWRPASQYDVAATRGADNVLARGCRIYVTVRLRVRLRGETMHWQANANPPLSVAPPLNVLDSSLTGFFRQQP